MDPSGGRGHRGEEPIRCDSKPQTDLTFDDGKWGDLTRLGPISRCLRSLIPNADSIEHGGDPKWWESVESELDLSAIEQNDRDLHSNKAQHALGLLQTLVKDYKATAPAGSDRAQVCTFLRDAVTTGKGHPVDLHGLAERWLGIVQPGTWRSGPGATAALFGSKTWKSPSSPSRSRRKRCGASQSGPSGKSRWGGGWQLRSLRFRFETRCVSNT